MTRIIQNALDDGVTMTLTVTGQIELTGNQPAIEKWLPIVREHKPAIVAALQDDPAVTAIKAWLAHIGETDPELISDCLMRCKTNPATLEYFLMRSREAQTNSAARPSP